MKIIACLVGVLVLITMIFQNMYLSILLSILILLYGVGYIIYLYNCVQVDALMNILILLNTQESGFEKSEELKNSMSWLQKLIYNKRKK